MKGRGQYNSRALSRERHLAVRRRSHHSSRGSLSVSPSGSDVSNPDWEAEAITAAEDFLQYNNRYQQAQDCRNERKQRSVATANSPLEVDS
ncbi:hypothetical protein J6590_003344 [Homalodisca vitripennis]|nr:hypothetical protein J6590_003344 [Homalodisca vitripennis]